MIVDQELPNFPLIRAMFGLILIAIIVYVIAMTPFRPAIAHSMAKVSSLFTRKKSGRRVSWGERYFGRHSTL